MPSVTSYTNTSTLAEKLKHVQNIQTNSIGLDTHTSISKISYEIWVDKYYDSYYTNGEFVGKWVDKLIHEISTHKYQHEWVEYPMKMECTSSCSVVKVYIHDKKKMKDELMQIIYKASKK